MNNKSKLISAAVFLSIPILFDASKGDGALKEAVDSVRKECEALVDEGYTLLILSDRGVDAGRAAIPALLAVSSVHHHLIRAGKRQLTGLIIETGEGREVMHFATL